MEKIKDVYVYVPVEALALIQGLTGFCPYSSYIEEQEEATTECGKVETIEGTLHFIFDNHQENKIPRSKVRNIARLNQVCEILTATLEATKLKEQNQKGASS